MADQTSHVLTNASRPAVSAPHGEDTDALLGQIRELRREVFDLNALFELARQFHEVWDVNALLDGLLLVAIEHTRAGAAAVATTESDGKERLSRWRSKGWDASEEPDWTAESNAGWVRCLCEHRHPMALSALCAQCPDDTAQLDAFRRAGCMMLAPMVRRDRVRGLLYLSGRVDGAAFTSGDLAFLDLLMDQFVVSLDNAVLAERERDTHEQLLIARQQLASAEKLAALGQMAATIAHEVRNPTGIIRNYLALIRPALTGHPAELEHLDIISEELVRVEAFVQNLLGAFHPHRSEAAALSLPGQLEQVTSFFRPRFAGRRIEVVNRLDGSVPPVYAEPEPLRQVLINLLLNAIDAMPRGGTITYSAEWTADTVELAIADTGSGISKELLDDIFNPFVTSKPQGEGSGLGLSICRGLLERFGAAIAARNQAPPAHGAVFTIRLRRAGDAECQSVDITRQLFPHEVRR
ncbi:MAG TPA: ATP-binding protein [bacterium]|nr:ATP-binding protein [bacterium]